MDKFEPVKCSDFIIDFDYITLKTNDSILIDDNPNISIYNQFVIIRTSKNCFLFDRFSGEFIREIGRYGKGPAEFMSTRGLINPNTKKVYFLGWNSNFLEYNFNGEFIKSIKIPNYKDDFETPSIPTNFTYYNHDLVCYFSNTVGTEKKLLQIFNNDDKEIYTFSNSNIFPKSRLTVITGESHFYHYERNLFFKENYNDTIYRVGKEGLIPEIILYTEKYKKPYESKWWAIAQEQNSEFITPFDIIETDSYVFFKFYFKAKSRFGVYEKEKKQSKITDFEEGISNDIDGFIPFIPMGISDKGELIGKIDAYIIKQWFTDNPTKATTLPIQLQKLKSVKETDNPIIVIANIKK
ncbi:6-bladed beta-propeller [Maribellus maritimus]|uniref:6-bladed beta-propeller n=1 Tax=Maribellus maritimus TaxID=2870838 RepID=UPI001EEA3EE9|nr:6-bladed beta-propeller [Maribellus maritimus]MCG6189360.1 DUF4934 domain-containing protein [Maribellus maritimus]